MPYRSGSRLPPQIEDRLLQLHDAHPSTTHEGHLQVDLPEDLSRELATNAESNMRDRFPSTGYLTDGALLAIAPKCHCASKQAGFYPANSPTFWSAVNTRGTVRKLLENRYAYGETVHPECWDQSSSLQSDPTRYLVPCSGCKGERQSLIPLKPRAPGKWGWSLSSGGKITHYCNALEMLDVADQIATKLKSKFSSITITANTVMNHLTPTVTEFRDNFRQEGDPTFTCQQENGRAFLSPL